MSENRIKMKKNKSMKSGTVFKGFRFMIYDRKGAISHNVVWQIPVLKSVI